MNSADASMGAAGLDPRTRLLLESPIGSTLLRLAAPNIVVMVAQAAVGLIETFFVGKLGTDALAGMALVFPVVMLMQMTSAGAMGGGIASAVARALGGGRRVDADALVWHAMVVALGFGIVFRSRCCWAGVGCTPKWAAVVLRWRLLWLIRTGSLPGRFWFGCSTLWQL